MRERIRWLIVAAKPALTGALVVLILLLAAVGLLDVEQLHANLHALGALPHPKQN